MRSTTAVLVVAALTLPAGLHGQEAPRDHERSRFSLGVHLGIALPGDELVENGAESGVAFGIEGAVHPSSRTQLYLELGTSTMASGKSRYPGMNIDVSGFSAGGRITPFPEAVVSPWIGGGPILKAVLVSGEPEWGESYSGESAFSLGWEVAGGATMRLGAGASLSGGLGYQRFAERKSVEGEHSVLGYGNPVSWQVGHATLLVPVVRFSIRL